jgi:hypothetical protein
VRSSTKIDAAAGRFSESVINLLQIIAVSRADERLNNSRQSGSKRLYAAIGDAFENDAFIAANGFFKLTGRGG